MTTQTKFTPGPWIANGSVVRAARDYVAQAGSESCNYETQHANAALIAAAPDLYAALRDLLADAEAADMAEGPHAGSLIEARKALAKALGR